jgi:hypothetical protein
MATARAIFQAHIDGLYPESIPIDLQWLFPAAVGQFQTVTLASGDNTLTIPTGTKLVQVVPPTTNAIVLKTGTGGNGWTLQPNMANLFTWSAGSLIINAASTVTGVQLGFY